MRGACNLNRDPRPICARYNRARNRVRRSDRINNRTTGNPRPKTRRWKKNSGPARAASAFPRFRITAR